uniref:Uncharacterized protein n=1 Tax=Rhizophora mucronata TaxID=61149 RepID=A0A2P2QNA4_RHIMU
MILWYKDIFKTLNVVNIKKSGCFWKGFYLIFLASFFLDLL